MFQGRNAERLQQTFDGIIREAESKLLDATIEALKIEGQQLKDGCFEEKQKVVSSMEAWRRSSQSSDPSLEIKADEFVKSAKSSPITFTSSAPQNGLLNGERIVFRRLTKQPKIRGEWRPNLL